MNDIVCNSSYLLNHSQTFVGVLTTLVVLCLFHNEGNFFTNYLKYLGIEMKDRLDEVKERVIHFRKEKIEESALIKDHEFWSTLAEEYDRNNPNSESLYNKCVNIYQQIETIHISCLLLLDKENKEISVFDKMEKDCLQIEKAKEFNLIALYTFFFSLAILSIDSFVPPGYYMTLSALFLYPFTLLSFVFTATIWTRFWKRVPNKDAEETQRRIAIPWYVKALKVILIIILPGIFCYLENLIIDKNLLPDCLHYLSVVIFLLLYFVTLRLFAFRCFNNGTFRCDRRLISYHFIYISVLSALIAGICAFMSHISLKEFAGYGHHTTILMYSSVSFILLNAFVLPFLLSHIKHRRILKDYTKLIEGKAIEELEKCIKGYNEVVAEIKRKKEEEKRSKIPLTKEVSSPPKSPKSPKSPKEKAIVKPSKK
jgi:hypothetical protein